MVDVGLPADNGPDLVRRGRRVVELGDSFDAPLELVRWFRTARPSVLVVEDDVVFRQALSSYLWNAGVIVSEVRDGSEAIDIALDPRVSFDAIILDLLLPIRDGSEVVEVIRSAGVLTPVLILSALSQPQDRVAGLSVGADDYLGKPVHFVELLLRLAKLIQRRDDSAVSLNRLRCGRILISVEKRQAWVGDDEIFLSPTEFDILRYLVNRSGLVLTRETIRSVIWPAADAIAPNLIDSHIAHLRRKLDGLETGASIQTVHGVGYRLQVDVDVH